jgi:hypothetical protein
MTREYKEACGRGRSNSPEETEQFEAAVTLYTLIQKLLSLNLAWNTCQPHRVFLLPSSVPITNSRAVPQIML